MSGGGRSTSVGDPVGQLVVRMLERQETDPVAAGVTQMLSATSKAVDALRLADAARVKASLPPPAPTVEPGVPGCVVHALYGLHEPVRARGRCRWCGDWAHSHEFADPPESAIRALEEERIRRELDAAAA
jgi:hypothetical protein